MPERTKRVSVLLFNLCGVLAAGCVAADDDVVDDGVPLDTVEQFACADPPCETGGGASRPVPAAPRVTARTDSSLTVQFTIDPDWTSYTLQKRPFGGAWAFGSGGNNPAPGPRTTTDGGKVSDARWCYRLRGVNAAGTGTSSEACGLTSTPAISTNPRLSRLQLRVEVANVTNAETAAKVSARLNSLQQPVMHFNALNPAPRLVGGDWVDSFARDRAFTYELELKQARRLRDVTEISLHNWGDDALCVERLDLIVNGVTAMSKVFGATATTCRWIETDASSSDLPELVVPFEELRAAPSFTSFTATGVTPTVSRDEIEARVEALVGNMIWNDGRARWGKIYGGRAVEVAFVDGDTLGVDVDLEGDIFGPNVEIDLDFTATVSIVPSTGGRSLRFDVTDVDAGADYPWWSEVLSFSLGIPVGTGVYDVLWVIEHYIETGIEDAFDLAPVDIPLGGGCPAGTQPWVVVTTDGGLQFGCTFVAAGG